MENIIVRFNAINSFYRSGEVEIFVKEDNNKGFIKNESRKFSVSETQKSRENTLQNIADKLFWEVKENYWDKNNIPKDQYSEYIRSLTISFEIDEYFLNVSKDKKKFYDMFRDGFFNFTEEQITKKFIKEKFDDYRKKIIDYENTDFTKFAYELILMCLCGINVLIMKQNPASYNLALRQIHSLRKIIDFIIDQEKETNPDSNRKALGLKGLNYYFEGRCYFSLGKFRKAEIAFKKSVSLYLEKMNLLIHSSDKEDAKTRMLALRRAGLAEVQLANLYLIESRIDEALEIMERVLPLLEFATGKIMLAYCQLIKIGIKRAKCSSEWEELENLEEQVIQCMNILAENVGKSHTYFKAIIELSLITFYKAKHLPLDKKTQNFNDCIEKLATAIEFGRSQNRFTNRRIAVEALTIRSHIHRNLANTDFANFKRHIDNAKQDADEAIKLSTQLKQLESDAQVAMGLIYQDLYEKNSSFEQKTIKTIKNKPDYKNDSRKHFIQELALNDDDNNHRISAICHLRLAELETIYQNNYAKAKIHFEHFLKYKDKIGHQYVLEFAENFRATKLEDQKYDKFLFAIEPREGNLSLKKWIPELKKFLIAEAVFYAALKYKDSLPAKRRRGENSKNELESISSKSKRNATRKSILADYIRDELGITGNERYKIAENNLQDFEDWCSVLASK